MNTFYCLMPCSDFCCDIQWQLIDPLNLKYRPFLVLFRAKAQKISFFELSVRVNDSFFFWYHIAEKNHLWNRTIFFAFTGVMSISQHGEDFFEVWHSSSLLHRYGAPDNLFRPLSTNFIKRPNVTRALHNLNW